MVDATSSGTRQLSDNPPRRATRSSWVAFPTVFGAVVIATVISSALVRLSVADPSVVGLVWAGLATVAVIGVLFPLLSLRLLRLEVVAAPTDVLVGELSSVEIRMTGRASGLRMRCGRSPMFVLDLTSPDTVRLPLEIAQRGVYDHVPIEVSTDAPFSILTVSERRIVPLRRQLVVGPRLLPQVARIGEIKGDELANPTSGHAVGGDTVRTVRPYVSGDPSHMVHWPSSARLGSLVVRELEPPQTDGVAVVLELHGEAGSDPVEAAVERALGVMTNALERGARVVLCAAAASGPLREEVTSRLTAQRRLAIATAGAVPAPPEGWQVQVISDRPGAGDG